MNFLIIEKSFEDENGFIDIGFLNSPTFISNHYDPIRKTSKYTKNEFIYSKRNSRCWMLNIILDTEKNLKESSKVLNGSMKIIILKFIQINKISYKIFI